MSMQRIAGPISLFSNTNGGTPRTYRLAPTPGGDGAGQVSYHVRVLDVKNTSTVYLALKLEHGAEGAVSTSHSTPIASTLIASAPTLLVGDAGSAMLAPWLHVVIEVDRSAGTGEQWVVVEVYEIRKALV